MQFKKKNKTAFTLIELFAVIAVVGFITVGIVSSGNLIGVVKNFVENRKEFSFDIEEGAIFHYDAQNSSYIIFNDYLRFYAALRDKNSSGNPYHWDAISGEFLGGFQANIQNDPSYGDILNIKGGFDVIQGPPSGGNISINHNSASFSFIYKGGSSGRIHNPYIYIKSNGFYSADGSTNELPHSFTSDWQIVTVVISENQTSYYINGALIGNIAKSSNSSSSNLYICQSTSNQATFCNNMKFAEILFFDSSLTEDQRKHVEKYLSDKWSIGISHSGAVSNEFNQYL